MKAGKKLLITLLSAICVTAGALCLSACDFGNNSGGSNGGGSSNGNGNGNGSSVVPGECDHYFKDMRTESKYLKSEATCTASAEYYFACIICGEAGEKTYEYGDPKGHSFNSEVMNADTLKSEATCTQNAEYYYSCSVCGERGTQTFRYGTVKGHTFDGEVAEAKYLKKGATCTEKAVYYYSCSDCGTKGAETFEYGEANGHTFGKHVEDKYIKIAPTYLTEAVYYYSCECGEMSEDTFIGDVLQATEGLEYTLSADGSAYTVTGIGTATDLKIVIAKIYNGKPVTAVGEAAFRSNSKITAVSIPESVEVIGASAFRSCSKLAEVNLYDGISEIGNEAFYGCNRLTGVTLPETLTSIGNSAFYGCGISEIDIPATITSVGSDAFKNCPLKTASVPTCAIGKFSANILVTLNITGGESIAREAFKNCNIIKNISIAKSVTSIGLWAFLYCTNLESIVVEEGNPVYSSKDNCLIETATKTLILGSKFGTIPQDGSVTKIHSQAFFKYSDLESVTIPQGVTSIGTEAFYGTGLTSIVIPDSVTYMEFLVFAGCKNLKEVTLGEGLQTMNGQVFDNTGLTTLYWNSVNLPLGDSKITAMFRNIPLTTLVIGEKVTVIPPYAFDCAALANITVADGNTKYYSVDNCLIEKETKTLILGATESIIPDDGSVTAIGEYAFKGRSELKSITIPDSITSIGKYAFYNTGLTTVFWNAANGGSISNSTVIFENCKNLTTVIIGKDVSILPGKLFSGSSIKEVYYSGTEDEWSDVTIGYNNTWLNNATKYYYSETEPDYFGNFWHYDESGNIVVWEITEEQN